LSNRGLEQLGLERANYGAHTLRGTKATLIYRCTKVQIGSIVNLLDTQIANDSEQPSVEAGSA
jgi:hypothetical protein